MKLFINFLIVICGELASAKIPQCFVFETKEGNNVPINASSATFDKTVPLLLYSRDKAAKLKAFFVTSNGNSYYQLNLNVNGKSTYGIFDPDTKRGQIGLLKQDKNFSALCFFE